MGAYAKISPKMMKPRDLTREEEKEEITYFWGNIKCYHIILIAEPDVYTVHPDVMLLHKPPSLLSLIIG